MTTTEHKHANILRAIADGREVEFRKVSRLGGRWFPFNFLNWPVAAELFGDEQYGPYEWRIKGEDQS